MEAEATIIDQIAALPTITIEDVEYTGPYFAMLLSLRESPEEEARRSPQLVAELGRLHSMANRLWKEADLNYRRWRDDILYRATNSIEEAISMGFSCASSPGTDARGNQKPAKLPSMSQAEAYVRQLEGYHQHQTLILQREEAEKTVAAALDAAKQRTWSSRIISDYHHHTA